MGQMGRIDYFKNSKKQSNKPQTMCLKLVAKVLSR